MNKNIALVFGAFVAVAAAGGATWIALAPRPATSADHTDARLVAHGKEIYAANCAACHGVNLEGAPNWQRSKPDGKLPAPPHDPSGHTWHHSDKRLFSIIKDGLGTDYETDMPMFGAILKDHDIWAVLAFIKSTWPDTIRAKKPVAKPVAG